MSSKADEAGLNKKKRYELKPELRFPEFRNAGEWREDDLSKLSDCGLSNGVFNDPKKVGKGYKLINVSDMYINTAINEDNLSLVELSRDEFLKNKVESGDLFFTRSSLVESGIAYSNIYLGDSNDITFDGHLIRFRPNEEILVSIFTNYLLRTNKVRSQLVARGKTATMTTIGQADVGGVRLSFPHINEQQKIADCLSSIDDRITAETQKLNTLKAHKKGLMQQLFPAEGETLPKLRFPKFQDVRDWEVEEFSKYIVLYRGSSPRPIKNYLSSDSSAVNWIKIGDTKSAKNFIISQVDEKITPEGAKRSRKVNVGELILANSMSYGKTYQVAIDGCIYDGWFVLRDYEKYFDQQFLLQFLNSEYMQKQYERFSAGGIVQNISSDIVYKTVLPHASLKEQRKIADCLSSLDELITAQTQKIATIKTHKKGLMQQLFPSLDEVKR